MARRNIFISYRRESASWAQLIYGALKRRYPSSQIFLDVVGIRGGEQFLQRIRDTIRSAGILIVIIHRGWLEHRDDRGGRALDDPNDFLRLEIAEALQQSVAILPVLVEGAEMPPAAALPAPLTAMAECHARALSAERWLDDEKQLLTDVAKIIRPRPAWTWSAAAGLAIVAASLFLYPQQCRQPPATQPAAAEDAALPKALSVAANVRAVTGPLLGVGMPSRAIDWTRFDSNIDFVYIGPQVGTPAVFLTAWNGLRAHKIRRGACLVFYAGREPVQQADAFATAVRIEPDDLPPCVVVERQSQDAKLVPAEIGRRLRICLERLTQKTGRRPVLCTRYDYWKPEFGDFSAYPLGFVPGNVRAAKLALPGTWKSWTLWLDTFDREVAGVGFVDVYYFNGGRAALDQFVAQSRVAS